MSYGRLNFTLDFLIVRLFHPGI